MSTHTETSAVIEVLTITEVARRLRIGRTKAYEMVRTGVIPRIPMPGRTWRVSSAVVDRLLTTGVDSVGPVGSTGA